MAKGRLARIFPVYLWEPPVLVTQLLHRRERPKILIFCYIPKRKFTHLFFVSNYFERNKEIFFKTTFEFNVGSFIGTIKLYLMPLLVCFLCQLHVRNVFR